MIKILKYGVIPKPTKIIYKATCQHCSCEFEFETEDIKSQEKHFGGNITVECPCCHTNITQPSSKYENRLVEV